MANKLETAREIINGVDKEMAALFVKRMQAAEMVAEYKKEHGLPIYDPVREDEILRKRSELIEDCEIREFFVNFIQNNMALSRAYQHRLLKGMKVAYAGIEGAFAHIAAKKLFPDAEMIACSDFSAAYRAVEAGECDVCVLPVENSYNGEVGQVTDLMFSGSLYINGMYDLSVTQDLLALEGASISDIKEVVSHPQAFGQCADYINKHGFVRHEFPNTALAARYVKEKADKSVAAIASKEAAEIFGLSVLDHDINESKSNSTRFAIFSRASSINQERRGDIHSILLFTVKNEAGALAKAIDIIGKYGFNMRTLRSRPMKELVWQYYFYIEIEGNIQSDKGKSFMEELGEYCDRLKFAGTYVKI